MAKHYDEYTVVIVDRPKPDVNRVTLNRPDKRNALNHPLRGQLLGRGRLPPLRQRLHQVLVRTTLDQPTALARTVCRTRIASTIPVPALGIAVASPASTAWAAA